MLLAVVVVSDFLNLISPGVEGTVERGGRRGAPAEAGVILFRPRLLTGKDILIRVVEDEAGGSALCCWGVNVGLVPEDIAGAVSDNKLE